MAIDPKKKGTSTDSRIEKSHFQKLQSFLHRTSIPQTLATADQTIINLQKCLSHPSGTDTILMNVAYLSLMASSILTTKLPTADGKTKQLEVNGSYTSLLGLVFSKTLSRHQKRALGRSGMLLKKISALVDDFRNFGRLWRIFAIYEAIRNLCDKKVHSKMLLGIIWVQTMADLSYQVLENVAYISGKGISLWDEKQQSRGWIWSSRFLGLVVVLDLFKVAWEQYSSAQHETNGEEGIARRPQVPIREVLVNLIYLPLIGHYTVEKGTLSQFWIGLLGSAAGGLKFLAVWNDSK